MSQYGILLPSFWGGATGREIAERGGKDAQLVAVYLTANQDANMIGLYPVELDVMRVRIRSLSLKALARALDVLGQVAFADYDRRTSIVWVREMAKFRLGLHVGPLDVKDNRVKGAQRLYRDCVPNPFLAPFFDRYGAELHLPVRRTFEPTPNGGPFKPLPTPFEGASEPFKGASKPVTEAVPGTAAVPRAEINPAEQDQRAVRAVRTLRTVQANAELTESKRLELLTKIAHTELDRASDRPDSDIAADIKDVAARIKMPYDSTLVGKAIASARSQRAARRHA